MKKIVIIESCKNCPYIDDLNYTHDCHHPESYLRNTGDGDSIPGWCPLEDAKNQ